MSAPNQSQRHRQLAKRLEEAARAVLQRGLSDPRLDHVMLTVTGVDLAPDLRNATLRISVLPDKAQTRAIAALNHATAHVRHKIGDELDSAQVPQLAFVLDAATKRQAAVIDALNKVRSEREAASEGKEAKDSGLAEHPPSGGADDAERETC